MKHVLTFNNYLIDVEDTNDVYFLAPVYMLESFRRYYADFYSVVANNIDYMEWNIKGYFRGFEVVIVLLKSSGCLDPEKEATWEDAMRLWGDVQETAGRIKRKVERSTNHGDVV